PTEDLRLGGRSTRIQTRRSRPARPAAADSRGGSMRAVIIGAGIGGPAAAVALRRAGIEPVLCAARPAPAGSAGLFLSLGINGMHVLRELGLLDAVLRRDVIPSPWLEFTSATGKRLGAVPMGRLDERTPSVTLMRGALQQTLVEAAWDRGVM